MKRLIIIFLTILITLPVFAQFIDLKQLKAAGIDINQYPPQDLLNLGIGNCDIDIIKSAVAKGVDLNKQIEGAGIPYFPLCSAISAASEMIIPAGYSIRLMLISEGGPDVYSGRSISDLRRDYIEIIRFLLQKGAKASLPPEYDADNIPLLLASKYRDIEIVRLLMEFKADPNSRDMMGNTALHVLGQPVAVPYPYKNAPEIANLLISKGARVQKNTDSDGGQNGATPLSLTKSMLNMIQSDAASDWRDLPFYNEVVSSLKSLIEIYSKM